MPQRNSTSHLWSFAITVLRHRSRQQAENAPPCDLSTADLDLVWTLIYKALLALPTITVTRSSEGFIAIPLCSLVDAGNISELFRLHVWLPDGERGVPKHSRARAAGSSRAKGGISRTRRRTWWTLRWRHMRRIDLCGLEAPEDGTEYSVVREMYGQSAAELARWVEAVRKGGQGVLKIDVPVDEAISMAVDRT